MSQLMHVASTKKLPATLVSSRVLMSAMFRYYNCNGLIGNRTAAGVPCRIDTSVSTKSSTSLPSISYRYRLRLTVWSLMPSNRIPYNAGTLKKPPRCPRLALSPAAVNILVAHSWRREGAEGDVKMTPWVNFLAATKTSLWNRGAPRRLLTQIDACASHPLSRADQPNPINTRLDPFGFIRFRTKLDPFGHKWTG